MTAVAFTYVPPHARSQLLILVSLIFAFSQRKEFHVAVMLPVDVACVSHALVGVVHGGLLFMASISVVCLFECTAPCFLEEH